MAWLHVVAAVVDDGLGRILIARRPDHLHQGGLWEFPGGKLEPGEQPHDALRRELHEEIGIDVREARPLLRVRHAYPDRRVLLDVWRVLQFSGEAHGREGQPVRWVPAPELPGYPFPAANVPIVAAARLPAVYLITPEPGPSPQWPVFLARLRLLLQRGIRLVQLRAHDLNRADYLALALEVLTACHEAGASLLLNGDPELAQEIGADGVHLSGRRLSQLRARPLSREKWVAASCHNAKDLELAASVGVDFAVLSPVKATASHPDAAPLGWERFGAVADGCSLPLFALGGLGAGDLAQAWQQGAQGIAAIRGLWDADPLVNFRRLG